MAEVKTQNGTKAYHEAAPLTKVSSGLSKQGSSASLRQRIANRRRSSAFDLPHVDSVVSTPSVQLDEIDLDKVPWWTSHRLRLAILSFLGFVSLYAQRVNLSIAIVSMVDHSEETAVESSLTTVTNNSTLFNTTYMINGTSTTALPLTTTAGPEPKCAEVSKSESKGEFHWNKELQGLILGAFFWGYLVFQVVGGRLSEKVGAKRVIAIAMFPVSVLTILSPFAARISPILFIVVRILIGLGESVMYPAAQALWARWAPPNERSRLIGFTYAGGQFGNAMCFPIAGVLCAYGFDGGWPSVFYVIGSAGFLWCCAWMIWAHDTPDDDKSISDIERKYIKYSIGDRSKADQPQSPPWKSIFTSKAVYAIIVGHVCGNYGAYMLLTKIPAYMKEVLKFDIKSNGVYSMLPYLTFWLFITISGTVADLLISRDIFSVKVTRKIMTAVGMFGPAAFLIGTGFMDCTQQIGAVVMLTASVGMCGFHFSGFFINHADIAPAFAGTLFGISNTMATIPGIVSPYVVSAMTKQGTRQQWQNTFYVAAAIYCFGAVWYLIFGEGEVQPWAIGENPKSRQNGKEDGVNFDLQNIHEEDEVDASKDAREEDADPRLLPLVKAGDAERRGAEEA